MAKKKKRRDCRLCNEAGHPPFWANTQAAFGAHFMLEHPTWCRENANVLAKYLEYMD